jgi:hypothetical protein
MPNPKTLAKQKLSDIISDINIGELAIRYFEKSPSWLYHKFDGIDGNKKPNDFNSEELETLKDALRDLAKRINAAADKL